MPTKRKKYTKYKKHKSYQLSPNKHLFMNSIVQEHETINGIPIKDVDIEHKYNNGLETIQGHYNNDPIYMIRTNAQQNKNNHKITKKKRKKYVRRSL